VGERVSGCVGAWVSVGAVRVRTTMAAWPSGRGSDVQRKGGGAGRTEPNAAALAKAGRRTRLLEWHCGHCGQGRHGGHGGLVVATTYPYSLPRLPSSLAALPGSSWVGAAAAMRGR
jgi:hypothetical protein